MVELEYHCLSDRVLGRITRSARRNAIAYCVPYIVINAINTVVYVVTVAISWFFNVLRFTTAVITRLLSNGNKLGFRQSKLNPPVFSVPLIVLVQRITRIFSELTPSASVAEVCISTDSFSYAPTGNCTPLLQPAKARFFLNSTVASAKNKVMMTIVRIVSSDFDNCHMPVLGTNVLTPRAVSYHDTPFNVQLKANYTMTFSHCREILRWNRAGGKVIRGLTIRREAEYKTCMGLT